jgi:hypothetical protein
MTRLEERLKKIAEADVAGLVDAEKSYGDSWKRRGGSGAFFVLARKWDRLENRVKNFHNDIFETIRLDTRREGAIDDVRDLRRYLMLVEDEMVETRQLPRQAQAKQILEGTVSITKVEDLPVRPVSFESPVGTSATPCQLCLVEPATLLCYGPNVATTATCAECWGDGAHDAPAHKAGFSNANELRT